VKQIAIYVVQPAAGFVSMEMEIKDDENVSR
jgi:hypothetical protein